MTRVITGFFLTLLEPEEAPLPAFPPIPPIRIQKEPVQACALKARPARDVSLIPALAENQTGNRTTGGLPQRHATMDGQDNPRTVHSLRPSVKSFSRRGRPVIFRLPGLEDPLWSRYSSLNTPDTSPLYYYFNFNINQLITTNHHHHGLFGVRFPCGNDDHPFPDSPPCSVSHGIPFVARHSG